ncbi:MAG TPA: TonB-dependent receptor [Steroidobacteraceae bacterium]|nr:TonB-dependent receptor [Steroidobacteraceae bacterium]
MEAARGRISNLRWCVLSSFAALGTLLNGPALAQAGPPAEPSTQIQEVLVTAQYREEKLQDTPIAITAMTSEMIQEQGAQKLSDILTNAPSVAFRTQSAAFGESVTAFIRGFGQADFDPAFEPGVGLYIDDVYYPRLTGANFDLMDVERVEVLRGPQGTLEGRNSEGGAIRFVTKKPSDADDAYLTATYGVRNLLQMRGATNFTLADHLYARISGTFTDQDGYVDVFNYYCAHPQAFPAPPPSSGGTKCGQYSLGDLGYRALRFALRYNPSDQLDATLSADYIHDAHNNGAEVLLYGNNANPNVDAPGGIPFDSRFLCGKWCNYTTLGNAGGSYVAGLIPPLQGLPLPATSGQQLNKYDAYDFALNINWGITDAVRLNSITGYHNWTNSFSIDGDLSPAQTQFGNNTLDHWFWSQELRLNMDFTKSLRGTLGGYYSDETTIYYTLQDIRYVAAGLPAPVCQAIGGLPTNTCPIFPLQFIGNDPVNTSSKAGFGTLVWDPTDALSFTGGVRYTKDYKSYTYYRFNLDGVTINPFVDPVGAANGAGYNGPNGEALTGRKAVFEGNRTDWHFSADYRFNPAVMTYASAGTGYKAGGVGPRPFNAEQARPFGPEKVTSYELGVKTDLFDRHVRFNTAAFYNDFTDAQIVLLSCPQYGGPGPCALPQNAGDAHVWGVETEIFAIPVGGLQIDLSGSYLHWQWKCVDPQVVPMAVPGAAGCSSDPAVINQLSGTPIGFIKEQGHVGIQYEFRLGNGGSITPRFDAAYQGPQTGSNTAAAPGSPSAIYGQVGGFTVANARLTWTNAKKDLQSTFEVTNLFNHYYFYSKFDLTGAGAGTITGSPGAPLGWSLTVRKNF